MVKCRIRNDRLRLLGVVAAAAAAVVNNDQRSWWRRRRWRSITTMFRIGIHHFFVQFSRNILSSRFFFALLLRYVEMPGSLYIMLNYFYDLGVKLIAWNCTCNGSKYTCNDHHFDICNIYKCTYNMCMLFVFFSHLAMLMAFTIAVHSEWNC